MRKKSRFKQGKYKPRYPEKYIGDIDNIIYRSSWELKWCQLFDLNKSILEWNSEGIMIPYMSIDNRSHRYFPDFFIRYKNKNGYIKQLLIEVKPHAQTLPPKKNSKFYGDSIETFLVNQKKWAEAKKFAYKNDMNFTVLTEKTLNSLVIPKF